MHARSSVDGAVDDSRLPYVGTPVVELGVQPFVAAGLQLNGAGDVGV
jgi:hypothetical protein